MPLQKPHKAFATWSLCRQRQHLLLLQLLLLSIATHCSFASPVSSPEIASKSSPQGNLVNGGVNQQQQTLKTNTQESQLNTLSAYAAVGYDGLSNVEFKPSYKLPDMETNFTPIQSAANLGTSNALAGTVTSPTPVIMQYISPQSLHENGVQYLQLIPTRPLIVPISPFMTPQAPTSYHQALTADNPIGDFANRSPAVLTPLHSNNAAPPAHPTLVNVQSAHLPYGLQTYANAIQPYRTGFRINREAKDKNLPSGMTLNMNEYMPGPHILPHHLYLRGRP